jgi:MoxR-like ATPase
LSPKNERKKHGNPIEVCVAKRCASVLMSVPTEWNRTAYQDDENLYIEQWVIDFYVEKNKEKILKEKRYQLAELERDKEVLESQRAALEHENELIGQEYQHKYDRIKSEHKELQENIDNKANELTQVQKRIEANQKKHKKLINEQKKIGTAIKERKQELQSYTNAYQERIKEMESKLERLKEFIQEKSQTLINLGLLDETEYLKLTGEQESKSKEEGYDFEDTLNSDYKKAAAYIQAYMDKSSIYYHRSVIEDFFSLLRTNDLIILAGDSGCGKTNLVKSFAEAIGGKSFIIPVKPNWTSAEDLLGYYNPLEKKYVITSFLTALIEAESNPETPYLICLDEMNLARVEYYFADFLSLLEERKHQPEIFLYSDDEASHALEEYKTFLRLIDKVKSEHKDKQLHDFVDLLQDEQVNVELHKLCGFHEGDSLLNYHSKLRRILSGFINTPSSIKLPTNVRIIGAINVDETTHYLSPKILDRAHVMKFGNPFLMDLKSIKSEIQLFDDLDVSKPINIKIEHLGVRKQYPELDDTDPLDKTLRQLGRDYLSKLGVEFGFRTVRQAKNYANELALFSPKPQVILNNFILHKVLPKLMLEGEQSIGNGQQKKDVIQEMRGFIMENLKGLNKADCANNSLQELEELILKSEANDWLVNYWVK